MIEAYAYSFNVFIRGDGYHSIYDFTSDVNEIAIPANVKASATSAATRAPVGMEPFKIFEDDRVRVSAILVPHGEVFPCYAYRFDLPDGRSVVFSGDTSKSDNVVTLAQDSDVLVHCAMEWEVVLAGALAHGKKPDDPLLVNTCTARSPPPRKPVRSPEPPASRSWCSPTSSRPTRRMSPTRCGSSAPAPPPATTATSTSATTSTRSRSCPGSQPSHDLSQRSTDETATGPHAVGLADTTAHGPAVAAAER